MLGDGARAVTGALHGLGAGVLMVGLMVGLTIGLFQAYKLHRGRELSVGTMQIGSLFTTVAALATIVYGNWLYIAYRATNGPRSYFLENMPNVHEVFFEFKEFAALYTLPLAVAATFMVWYYGDQLRGRRAIRTLVAVTLVLAFAYFAVAYGLGAGITALRAV